MEYLRENRVVKGLVHGLTFSYTFSFHTQGYHFQFFIHFYHNSLWETICLFRFSLLSLICYFGQSFVKLNLVQISMGEYIKESNFSLDTILCYNSSLKWCTLMTSQNKPYLCIVKWHVWLSIISIPGLSYNNPELVLGETR